MVVVAAINGVSSLIFFSALREPRRARPCDLNPARPPISAGPRIPPAKIITDVGSTWMGQSLMTNNYIPEVLVWPLFLGRF